MMWNEFVAGRARAEATADAVIEEIEEIEGSGNEKPFTLTAYDDGNPISLKGRCVPSLTGDRLVVGCDVGNHNMSIALVPPGDAGRLASAIGQFIPADPPAWMYQAARLHQVPRSDPFIPVLRQYNDALVSYLQWAFCGRYVVLVSSIDARPYVALYDDKDELRFHAFAADPVACVNGEDLRMWWSSLSAAVRAVLVGFADEHHVLVKRLIDYVNSNAQKGGINDVDQRA